MITCTLKAIKLWFRVVNFLSLHIEGIHLQTLVYIYWALDLVLLSFSDFEFLVAWSIYPPDYLILPGLDRYTAWPKKSRHQKKKVAL